MKTIRQIYDILQENNLLAKGMNPPASDIDILDITYDSREVKPGTLFFCKGLAFKKEYLENSIKDGASAYVSETDYGLETYGLIVTDVRKAMLVLAAFFYDYPDRKMHVMGVTGTKGKSTTVTFLKSIFDTYLKNQGKKPCGLISGIKIFDGVKEEKSKLTTPEAIPLYKSLSSAVENGLEYMVIEVSSQALKYLRINNVHFEMAAFLNIGNDHVSEIEHPSFKDYFESKLKLIDLADNFIYNIDMEYAKEIQARIDANNIEYQTFSLEDKRSDIHVTNLELKDLHTKFQIEYKGISEEYSIFQPGHYNVENALAAILFAKHFNLDYDSIKKGLKKVRVEGRDEFLISEDKNLIVWVSYAHNGLSFEKSFELINEQFQDFKIISMFGGSGNRAKVRMEEITHIGAQHSDLVLVVPDDPGTVAYDLIVNEMKEIIESYGTKYEVYQTRKDGIRRAFDLVDGKTLLFLAGKGNDAYNFIDGQYIDIESDLELATKYLEEYNKSVN